MNAPGPKGSLWLGDYRELKGRGQVSFFVDCWKRYGDLVRFRLGPLVAHIVVHPDHVQRVLAHAQRNYGRGVGYRRTMDLLGQGLLTSEGTLWQRQRRLMQPPFTPRATAEYGPQMVAVAERQLERWRGPCERGEPVDALEDMLRLTLEILAKALLNLDLGTDRAEMVHAFREACEIINERLKAPFVLPLAVPLPSNRRLRNALRTLDRIVYRQIDERRRSPSPPQDVFSKLLWAKDPETGAGMTDQQIRDELVTLFFAGHETGAVLMAWAWLSLSQHPEVERRLHAELDQVLGGQAPRVEVLPQLPYARAVLAETLRLYPSVWTFPRQALGPDEIGGFEIPRGSLIFPSAYLTHRHPDFWERPDEFAPERFLPGRSESQHQYAYYPFGGGPRTCIGVHFGLLEAQLVLVTLAQRYRLRLVPGHQVEPRSVITLQPAGGLPMFVERR